MTPAIKLLQSQKVPHTVLEYEHDPSAESFGEEAATKLGVAANRVFKTLLVDLGEKELGVGILPVSSQLSMKLIARALGAKKAKMAAADLVERTTGYVVGGVSPLGQKKRLRTVVDSTARQFDTILVSAGRRGLQIELGPQDLIRLTAAIVGDIRDSD